MMPIVGTEWIVDATGCEVEALRDVVRLRAVFARAIDELDLLVAGEEVWHRFPEPGGVTGLVLLTESHLACHTYPEHGIATINLYCCRVRPAWPWAERLGEMLGAQAVAVRVVERPASTVAAQAPPAAAAKMLEDSLVEIHARGSQF